jgi:hypothetical protein
MAILTRPRSRPRARMTMRRGRGARATATSIINFNADEDARRGAGARVHLGRRAQRDCPVAWHDGHAGVEPVRHHDRRAFRCPWRRPRRRRFGALGTIPASTWGIIGVDAVAAGTISRSSRRGQLHDRLRDGSARDRGGSGEDGEQGAHRLHHDPGLGVDWVAGTDALAGGTGGTPATTTNYYNIASPWDIAADSANAITLGSIALTAKQIGNMVGTALSV